MRMRFGQMVGLMVKLETAPSSHENWLNLKGQVNKIYYTNTLILLVKIFV